MPDAFLLHYILDWKHLDWIGNIIFWIGNVFFSLKTPSLNENPHSLCTVFGFILHPLKQYRHRTSDKSIQQSQFMLNHFGLETSHHNTFLMLIKH